MRSIERPITVVPVDMPGVITPARARKDGQLYGSSSKPEDNLLILFHFSFLQRRVSLVINLHWWHARIHGSAWRDAGHSLVALADLLHGEEQDEPGNAHKEFAPLPVGGPDGAKQIMQLLVHWVMAGEADLPQLQDVC